MDTSGLEKEQRAFDSWRYAISSFLAFPTPGKTATTTTTTLNREVDPIKSSPDTPAAIAIPDEATDKAARLQESKDLARCEKWKKKLLQSSPMVRFMLDNLKRQGCPFNEQHFRCTPCEITRAGGFAPDFGVVLCQNAFLSKKHMEDTMTHELIHAYDHCTAKVDWSDPEHYACSTIRAISLSGECKFTRELKRGFFSVAKHHQACVKRRAITELKQLPSCQGDRVAEDAVRAVWDSCFRDTAPFDEIP
ncbi:peptidase M76 family-domain-containing protein [Fimicolochytrium jonesii]|uniref:peptidase M76 family-domain-containing protein n=1 Tax=Fimicolochytrium jonesii TaxID=1396493 RepID=UPI0022FED2C3|nr:peptidase M76 family-domain-containing protein [Fimicolochytrium jonesii]KAI8815743.1 peptidase M76 family-domain-containing protein [Fimicolochytrium jonesii]